MGPRSYQVTQEGVIYVPVAGDLTQFGVHRAVCLRRGNELLLRRDDAEENIAGHNGSE